MIFIDRLVIWMHPHAFLHMATVDSFNVHCRSAGSQEFFGAHLSRIKKLCNHSTTSLKDGNVG